MMKFVGKVINPVFESRVLATSSANSSRIEEAVRALR